MTGDQALLQRGVPGAPRRAQGGGADRDAGRLTTRADGGTRHRHLDAEPHGVYYTLDGTHTKKKWSNYLRKRNGKTSNFTICF